MLVHFFDLLQPVTESRLEILDSRSILILLYLSPGLRILQGLSAFVKFFLDLHIFFVKSQILFTKLGSVSGIFSYLHSFSQKS